MHYLSGFLMTKDENRYLREWVAFHRTQGYTKFYIYDNMSKVPVVETLAKEISEGLIDVTMWEDNKVGRHHRAMESFLKRKDVKTMWVSMTDTDEFAYGIECPLANILERYECKSAIKLKWLCFGSSGHESRPDDLVINSYTKCGNTETIKGGKSIVKFGKVKGMLNCHNPRKPHAAEMIPITEAILNHYLIRSKEDWKEKSERGGGNGGRRNMRLCKDFDIMCSNNENFQIKKYVDETKKFLE
jgi:hypothetical protein